ncbi:uncharacterized protein TRAVEDRAFT_111229 [Trametes versicolor FP-101664 SS1]|uniref:uncharacterized protein n=1 Tax=Trametes versicolor (strain FP-101664) TaxID=717944 RepID=UPI00046222EA|nr:uncharacterized protein TRAVEDRAFT_111229 [Trametes versicolor FP-101664 SS1]EIW64262.1 hypothetical protein TRAVEDRAFT_111229 [Trametes versicolor FP-101664 SS1]
MATFARGVKLFRDGQYQDAVDCFSEVLELGGDKFKIYDSRAAAYQKLDKLKDALRDAKAVIDLQPDRWQGYARSARVFCQARKYEAATRMVELALERMPPNLDRRRDEMVLLQEEIATSQAAVAKAISKRTYHFGKLPVEIAAAMFSMVLEDNHAYVVTLAQVCQNWRHTILDTPSFWSTLVLGNRHPKRKVKFWRERSRGRIHELAVLDTFTDFIPTFEELRSVSMDTLRSIRLDAQALTRVLKNLPNVTPLVLASLHQVVLHAPSMDFLNLVDVPEYNWRVLELTNVLITDYYALACRLLQLESLSLSNCPSHGSWDDLLWLLSRNPKLARLDLTAFDPVSLNFTNEPGDREELPAIITVPSLVDIRIEDTDQLANVILPRLIAPSLASLRILQHRQRLDGCLSWLAAGPAATLTTLSIQRSALNVQALLDVLPVALALETLELTHVCDVALPVLKALGTLIEVTGPTENHAIVRRVRCPNLRKLDISHCPDVVAWPVIALVKLRLPEAQPPPPDETSIETKDAWPPVRRLESLVIDGCPDMDADKLPWLRAAVPSVSCVYLTRKTAKWRR